MRALRCHADRSLDTLTVEEIDSPIIGDGEVLVAVEAASVNFADALVVTGAYQVKAAPPFTPGSDFAGVVIDAAPDTTFLAVGDRVHGMSFIGAFAEQVAVPERKLRRTPDAMSPEVACTAGSVYRTAYDAVVTVGGIQPARTLVVLGASGAIGSAAVQIGKAAGARVIACASTVEKVRFCESLGADDVINTGSADLKTTLKNLCPGGVDVVIDPVGGVQSEPALRALGYGGRFVVVGFASNDIPRIPLNLVLLKGVIIKGYDIASFEQRQAEQAATNRDVLEDMLASGRIVPPITQRYALDEAAEALRAAHGRSKYGKIILDVGAQR